MRKNYNLNISANYLLLNHCALVAEAFFKEVSDLPGIFLHLHAFGVLAHSLLSLTFAQLKETDNTR